MIKSIGLLGIGFAFLAAICNGTVGVLSRISFSNAMNYADVAFWRCFGAFVLISVMIFFKSNGLQRVRALAAQAWKISISAFLGLFMLYHFETYAFSIAPIPLVSILVFSGGIFAIILDIFVLKEKISIRKFLAIFLVFIGSFLVISQDGIRGGTYLGIIYSITAGIGYASFIFSWKFFRIESSIESLWWFFLFGTIFLFIPFFLNGHSAPETKALPTLLSLVIIPSIGGFFCTTLSLKYIEAYKTQVIESSEPMFTSLFALAFFGEFLSFLGIIGAITILFGSILITMPEKKSSAEPLASA